MTVTEIFQSGVYLVYILWEYLLGSTFQGSELSQNVARTILPLIFDLAESNMMQDATM